MDTTELQNQAIEIRDAENEGENTATKVGTLLVNIIQALEGTVTEESLTETLEAVEEALQRDYASLVNGTVKWHQRGVIFLKSMGSALDNIDGGSYTPSYEIGDTWFSPTSGGLVHKTQDGNETWSVRLDAVYINSHTLRVYKWASGSMVELGSERNPVMIDYMVSKTLDSIAVGEVFWQSSNSKLVVKTGASSVRMYSPDPSVIYCARDTKSLMIWDTTTSTWQSVGGGSSSGLTKVISNIELVNSKVNALINALANIAFKQLPKPVMTELDWGGDKYAVTLNNTLSGCTADKSGVQQVSEGNNLVITITADDGKLLRSVTSSSGDVIIAQSKTTATITISNVMSDLSVTIQANATAKGSYNASISDSNVQGTGTLTGIEEGSSWGTELSVKQTAPEGTAITSIEASMAGGGTISVNGNTISTDYVTGNITIHVVTAVAGRFTISLPDDEHIKVTSDAEGTTELSNQSVPDNGSTGWQGYIMGKFTVGTVGSSETYDSYDVYNVKVMMGTNDITSTVFNPSSGLINIAAVTVDVVISADTMKFTEGRVLQSNGALYGGSYADPRGACVSDFIQIPSDVIKLMIDCGGTPSVGGNNRGRVLVYDTSKQTILSSYEVNGSTKGRYFVIDLTSLENPSFVRISYSSPVSGGVRDYSIRRSRYVLGIKNNGYEYLYRGVLYDGRYESEYEMEWDSYYGNSNNDNPSTVQYKCCSATKKLGLTSGCNNLLCNIGVQGLYGEASKFSNIRLYTNESFETQVVDSQGNIFTKSVGDAVSVRLSSTNIDTSYIIDMENESFIYRGLLVTETAADLIAAYNNSQNS